MKILDIYGCRVHIWCKLVKIYAPTKEIADKIWNYIESEGLCETTRH